jgi:hypothetical protein
VRHERITECAPHHTRPGEFVGCDRGSRADIRFRIESKTKEFQKSADRPDKCRVEPFHAHPAKACVAFDTFIGVNAGAIYDWIDGDGSHRTDRNAIAARHALPGVDLHTAMKPQKWRVADKVFWAAKAGSMLVFPSLMMCVEFRL